MNEARWKLSKGSKLCMASELRTSQADLAKLLCDEDEEVRFQAARHPGVGPSDLLHAIEAYPELQMASVQAFLLWEHREAMIRKA